MNDLESMMLSFEAEARKIPPDYQKMKSILKSGLDINEPEDDQDNMLSEIIIFSGNPYFGDTEINKDRIFLYDITCFFLDHGFDVQRINPESGVQYGSMCIENLIYSTYNQDCLECLKILLQNGADPLGTIDGCTVYEYWDDQIKEYMYVPGEIDFDWGNYFEAGIEIINRWMEHRPYKNIFKYDYFYGREIDSVFAMCNNRDSSLQNTVTPEKSPFVFASGLWALVVKHDLAMWVEPLAGIKERLIDVSNTEKVKLLIGEKIRLISLEYHGESLNNRAAHFWSDTASDEPIFSFKGWEI